VRSFGIESIYGRRSSLLSTPKSTINYIERSSSGSPRRQSDPWSLSNCRH